MFYARSSLQRLAAPQQHVGIFWGDPHPVGSQNLWQVPSVALPTCPLSIAWLLGDTEVANGCDRLSTIECHTTREAAVTLRSIRPQKHEAPALCWNKSWVPPWRFRCLAARPITEGWLSTCRDRSASRHWNVKGPRDPKAQIKKEQNRVRK